MFMELFIWIDLAGQYWIAPLCNDMHMCENIGFHLPGNNATCTQVPYSFESL